MSRQPTATTRLKYDYARIIRDPVPYITAAPMPSDILEWHYVFLGPEDTPYEGGFYHGKLLFPKEFPFKPPIIFMITPNGRFKCNTSIDFHPETWRSPIWSVSTILMGLLSFMVETTPTLGSIETSDYTKRQLSAQSGAFNIKSKVFCELFPEISQKIQNKLKRRENELAASMQSSSVTSGRIIANTSNNAMVQPQINNQDLQGSLGCGVCDIL